MLKIYKLYITFNQIVPIQIRKMSGGQKMQWNNNVSSLKYLFIHPRFKISFKSAITALGPDIII